MRYQHLDNVQNTKPLQSFKKNHQGMLLYLLKRVSHPPIAYMASSPSQYLNGGSSNPNPTWYLDSRASTHVTPDVNNLSIHTPYSGPAKVAVGNGQSLLVQITSFGKISTLYQFKLNNIFHVPNLSTSLLYVHQLAEDNNCLITFDANAFVILDKCSNLVIY